MEFYLTLLATILTICLFLPFFIKSVCLYFSLSKIMLSNLVTYAKALCRKNKIVSLPHGSLKYYVFITDHNNNINWYWNAKIQTFVLDKAIATVFDNASACKICAGKKMVPKYTGYQINELATFHTMELNTAEKINRSEYKYRIYFTDSRKVSWYYNESSNTCIKERNEAEIYNGKGALKYNKRWRTNPISPSEKVKFFIEVL
jgi:hypothetical protein